MTTWTAMNDLAYEDVVTEGDMDAIRGNILYLLDPAAQATVQRNNTTAYTTTSTNFVDVDGTYLAHTITTAGGPVLALVSCTVQSSGAYYTYLDIDVDGTRHASAFGGGILMYKHTTTYARPHNLAVLIDVAAGEHTFTLQWKVSAGTASMYSDSSTVPVELTVIEI